MNALHALMLKFAQDEETRLIVGMIALDFVSGVIAALRSRRFDWKQVANYLGHDIVPLVIGYAALWFVVELGLVGSNPVITQLTQTWGAGTAMAALAASIFQNVGEAQREGRPLPRTTEE